MCNRSSISVPTITGLNFHMHNLVSYYSLEYLNMWVYWIFELFFKSILSIWWAFHDYLANIWWAFCEYLMSIWWAFDKYLMSSWWVLVTICWLYDDHFSILSAYPSLDGYHTFTLSSMIFSLISHPITMGTLMKERQFISQKILKAVEHHYHAQLQFSVNIMNIFKSIISHYCIII